MKCAHCGKRVLKANGFFRTYPEPLALHHDCKKAYWAAQPEPIIPGYGSSI